MRTIPLTLASLALITTLATASPGVRVDAIDGVTRVELVGNFGHARYTVFRAVGANGAYAPVGQADLLCIGACFVEDPEVRAGSTYWYRFDLEQVDGSRLSFGPFAVTIPAILARVVGARVVPNPVRGPASIEVFLAGAASAEPLPARVRVFDLQGRLLRQVHDGPLPRGLSRLTWDGLDAAGRPAAPGACFVTVSTPLGEARTRLLRVR